MINISPRSICDEVKIKIIKTQIEPLYENDIKRIIIGKKCCKFSGQIFETMSKIFVAIGSILSYASGYYKSNYLALIAGSVSTFSLALLQLSSFSYKEYKKQCDELNIILKKLDIDTIPTDDIIPEIKNTNNENNIDSFINNIIIDKKKQIDNEYDVAVV